MSRRRLRLFVFGVALQGVFSLMSGGNLQAADEYSFELSEIEKKSFEIGGYVELKGEYSNLNEDSAFYKLNFYQEPRSTFNRYTSTLQLDGNFNKEMVALNWRLQAFALQDDIGWTDNIDVFEAYASFKPTPKATLDLGKKVFKWGKGYAWNPAAFIDRPKDPNNPEESLEGFIGGGLDLIRSFSGPLQTVALTTVALPVWQGVNEDFGEQNNVNLAAKLYLLYKDTDIDFMVFTGNSRSSRYGLDFSKNLATNFEVHGEFAYTPRQQQKILGANDVVLSQTTSDTSYLLGLRYLTESDLTTIVEFYRNGDGYTEAELSRFLQLVTDGYAQYRNTGSETLLQKAANLSQAGFGRPQAGRNYLYLRTSQKEPFDILYLTPALTAIVNLDDQSLSLSPELVYTGITNLEMRIKLTWLNGNYFTEYGEKSNENKAEIRLRYFFF